MAINSDIGLSLLNSLGASRFDVGNMARVLANADVAAQRAALEQRQQKLSYTQSGYDLLNRALDGFISQMGSLLTLDTFTKKGVSVSDESVLKASISGKPVAGTYQIEVQQLARAHTLATSNNFASVNDVVGTGTLTLTVGGVQTDITIDSSNNTLEGIRAAVNAANIGVSATIINTGSGYKLMFTSDRTGAANAISVSVVDDDGNNTDNAGLSQLVNANMLETSAAQDAQLVVNGLTITRDSNTISDVIDGLTLDLQSAAPGQTQTLTVNGDTSEARQAVQDFVDLYNSLQEVFKQLGSYDNTPSKDDPTAGSLKGDSTLRFLKERVRQMVTQPLSNVSGAVSSLADIGILTKRDGTLEFDSSKLDAALAADPEAVGRLFSASISATDPLVEYVGSNDKTPEGTWDLFVSQAAEQATLSGAALGGSGTITLDSSNNTLDIKVNGISATLTLVVGTYTKDQLAQLLQTAINSNADLAAQGAKVSVRYDAGGDNLVITTDKFVSAASIEFTGGTAVSSGVLGFAAGDSDTGLDVAGQLKDPVSGNTYTFAGQGRKVSVSNYALDGLPKGLEFTVDGTATGSRGTITFNRGYADRIVQAFKQWMSDDGPVGRKLDNLAKKQKEYEEQQAKIDARYQMLEERYRLQFGRLQAVLDSFKQTQSYLSAQLAALNPSNNKK